MTLKTRAPFEAVGVLGGLLITLFAFGLSACGSSTDNITQEEREQLPGIIAFISEENGGPEISVMQPSGDSLRRLTQSKSVDYPVGLLPGDSLLLVISVLEDSLSHREQLVLLPLKPGVTPRELNPAGYRIRNPSVSSDGEWIVFEADFESFRDIYRLHTSGEPLERLTNDEQGNFEPNVSPDGQHIVFQSSRDESLQIYRMAIDGTEEERLTRFHRDDMQPSWSPDGEMIAFMSDREGADRIFVMDANGNRLSKLNADLPNVLGDSAAADSAHLAWQESQHVWSPDGKEIAFVRHRLQGPAQIWVTNLESEERRQLSPDDVRDNYPAWSPDGRYLVFVSEGEDGSDLFIVRKDGSGRTRITDAAGDDWLPRWLDVDLQ